MILDELNSWRGAIEIDGVKYHSVDEAKIRNTGSLTENSIIVLLTEQESEERKPAMPESVPDDVCMITVKQYMTKKSSPGFDFMSKWNNDIPMPLMTMVGTVEKETPGMVYMKLHGDMPVKSMEFCMKCGRQITNPVSKYFGMGPECGGHNYVSPFGSDTRLLEEVNKYRTQYLQKITWEGWIIKSAITSCKKLQEGE